jgi:alanine racemase
MNDLIGSVKSLFRDYKNLNRIEVSKKTLLENYRELKKNHPEAGIAPVMKSNAYGHGLAQVAPVIDSEKPAFICVDSLYEAYELNKLAVISPVLIMGYTKPENYRVKPLPFHYSVFDRDTADVLNRYQKGAQIHIKIDTGMSRYGIIPRDLRNFIRLVKSMKNISIAGLWSHLSDADNNTGSDITSSQIKKYRECLAVVKSEGVYPRWRHISASAGAFKIFDKIFNLIRPGLALYGINPLNKRDPAYNRIIIKPVMKFISTLSQVKYIPAGASVGYMGTYKVRKRTKIGIIPAGYYEGIDRRMSNKGFVKIHGIFCPIIGRVSMNITAVDLTGIKTDCMGEDCTVFSDNPDDINSITSAAGISKTIPYEILVHLASTVRRELI